MTSWKRSSAVSDRPPTRPLAGLIALLLAGGTAAVVTVPDEKQAPVALPPTTSTTLTTTTSATVAPTAVPTMPATTTTVAAPPPSHLPVVSLVGSDAPVVIAPSGVVVPVVGRAADGVEVLTPCENRVGLQWGVPVRDVSVVVDAGHGGSESGATGPNGLREKALNLTVANITIGALKAAGVSALPTRVGDYRMTLEARASVAKALRPRAFVSIHHNGAPDGPSSKPGTETYYQVASPTSAESKRLAGLIYEEVVAALSAFPTTWHADNDAGAKYRRNEDGDDYYGVLRRTKGVTAVLAELAFLSSSPGEAETLARPEVQRAEGEAVARAVLRFLRTPDPGSGFVEPYPRGTEGGGTGGTRNCVDPQLS